MQMVQEEGEQDEREQIEQRFETIEGSLSLSLSLSLCHSLAWATAWLCVCVCVASQSWLSSSCA